MIMRKIIILVCYCFLLAACGNSAKTNNSTSADSTATEVVDIHNAETSLDYEGRRLLFTLYTSTGTVHLMKRELIHSKVTY